VTVREQATCPHVAGCALFRSGHFVSTEGSPKEVHRTVNLEGGEQAKTKGCVCHFLGIRRGCECLISCYGVVLDLRCQDYNCGRLS